MNHALRLLGTLALGLSLLPASAGTVAARLPVIVYDGPAESSVPRYLLGKDYPVVVVAETAGWVKICLHDRSVGYIHRRDLVPGSTVIVVRDTKVRTDPSLGSPTVLQAGSNLLLASTGDPIEGWLPVHHSSGISGFIPIQDVWGHSAC